MNHFTGRTSTVGEMEPDNGQYDTPGETSVAHGCAMMVKKEIIEKVWHGPEKFSFTMRNGIGLHASGRPGTRYGTQPTPTIYHKESMSVGKKKSYEKYSIIPGTGSFTCGVTQNGTSR